MYIDKTGELLEELITSRGMIVANEGNKPTFVRGNQTSCIDVTMCTEDLGGRIKKWRVLDDESLSDHRPIMFEVDRTKK